MNLRRMQVVFAMLALSGFLVVARCVQISVVEHSDWVARARRQQQQIIEVPGPRGRIFSSDGYDLATSVARVAIQVDTRILDYPEIFARAAAPLLNTDADELAGRLRSGPRAVWLAQQVPRDVGEQVRSLAPRAVVLVPDFERIYPMGTLAAPVVGFVGREELATVGRAGFEHHFDAYLAGEAEQYLAVNDAIQRRVRLERLHRGRAGYDLRLTLSARLQARCEAELAAALADHDARAGSAVVMEARTGRILAIASLPSFDPANPGAAPRDSWRLRPVQDAIEPGSVVKPLIVASALAADVVSDNERFDCTSHGIRVAGHWIRDHAEPGRYTVDEVVVYSANAGIIEIAERIPPEWLWRALKGFGFGNRTGVGYPAEARGLLPETRSWSKMSRAGLALGQELTVSPLQLAAAYAAFANRGWMPHPYLVVPTRETEESPSATRPAGVHVMDEDLAERVSRILEAAVTDGTGELAAVPGYRVAGKTGTAQRAIGGRFDDLHHVAWFAGFFPLPDPRIVIVVSIEDPMENSFWASAVAAPVFSRIAEAAATIFDVPPTERPLSRRAANHSAAIGRGAA